MRNGGGRVLTFYGKGDGKTCAALGHAVRASGQDRKVVVFHFLKGRTDVGEYKFFTRDAQNIKVHLCGKPEFFYPDSDPKPYILQIGKCMGLIEEIITDTKCDMLILDEILYAVEYGLVKEEELVRILKKRKDMHIILTGGSISERIRKASDIITEMSEVHHHYHDDHETILGLDY